MPPEVEVRVSYAYVLEIILDRIPITSAEVKVKNVEVGPKPDGEYISQGIQCSGLSFWQKSSGNRIKGIESR